MSDEYISREAAISHPFANGQYDREHASKDFIMGYESYKEWLEALPAADVKPSNEIVEAVDEAIRVLNAINSRGNETFDYGDYCDLYDAISAIYPT